MTFTAPSPQLTEPAVALIKHFEGRRLDAYTDAVGVPTIGYGHTGDVRRGASITPEQAEQLLNNDLNVAQADVLRSVRVPLNENEYGALVSLAFSIGGPALARSRCVKLLNKGDKTGAAEEIERFVKARVGGQLVTLKGLELRRKAERELFLCKPGDESKDGYLFLADQTIPLPDETLPEPPIRATELVPPIPFRKISTRLAGAAVLGGSVGAAPAIDQVSDAWRSAGGPNIQPAIQHWVEQGNQWLMSLPHAAEIRDFAIGAAQYVHTHHLLEVALGALVIFMLRRAIFRMRTA